MDTYKFTIRNYNAIENAEICLDGLTVLAGINGCGKSTIARWLYGFVKYSNSFDEIVEKEASEKLHKRNIELWEIERFIGFLTHNSNLPRRFPASHNLEAETVAFHNRVKKLSDLLNSVGDNPKTAGVWRELGLDLQENTQLTEKISLFEASENHFLNNVLKDCREQTTDCSISELFRIIENHLDLDNKAPRDMQFCENGTDLLDYTFCQEAGESDQGRFQKPLNLKRAIYVDTPFAVTNMNRRSYKIWGQLDSLLTAPVRTMSEAETKIANEIKTIIGGSVVLKDTDYNRNEIRYVSNSGNLDLSVDDIATGMKSFTYLLKLLENGYLDSETLLIIDEPEAHLHPQWVVRFAKILVLLQKNLGLKIMIATHDPDMVAAVHTIATAEEIGNTTTFYQAQINPRNRKYNYINEGNSISAIFQSFNIAIDRIDSYKNSGQ